MDTIVVAIDFSKSSVHALEYAINFANMVGADIHMVWVDNMSSEEVVFAQFSNEDRMEHKRNFEELCEKYKKKLKTGMLSFSLKKGKVHIELAKVARLKKADLIIAGTHGATGFEEYWIGSNAYRIVAYAPCPVITIRNDFNCCDKINAILFPIDSTIETKHKLPFTASIAKIFNATIHVLGLYSTTLKSVQKRIDNHVNQAIKYFEENGVQIEVEKFKPDNTTKSIINYASNISAELITIMTEQENTTAHIFLGPHAQQLISHSPIPILSLKSKEVIKQQIN